MKPWLVDALLLFVFGGLIAVVAGVAYHVLEWLLKNCDGQTRGMWEGMMVVVVYQAGANLAKRIVDKRRAKRTESTKVKP